MASVIGAKQALSATWELLKALPSGLSGPADEDASWSALLPAAAETAAIRVMSAGTVAAAPEVGAGLVALIGPIAVPALALLAGYVAWEYLGDNEREPQPHPLHTGPNAPPGPNVPGAPKDRYRIPVKPLDGDEVRASSDGAAPSRQPAQAAPAAHERNGSQKAADKMAADKKAPKEKPHEELHALMLEHLPLVTKYAKWFLKHGVPLTDLEGDGAVGLAKAVRKFDPSRQPDVGQSIAFENFAKHWILREIGRGLKRELDAGRIPLPSGMMRKLGRLNRIERDLAQQASQRGEDPADIPLERVAERFGMSVKYLQRHVLPFRNTHAALVRLDEPAGSDESESLMDELADKTNAHPLEALEEAQRVLPLQAAMQTLLKRERYILERRSSVEEDVTHAQLAVELGVTRPRIGQLEARAHKKLREALKDVKFSR